MSFARDFFSGHLIVEDAPQELSSLISERAASLVSVDGDMAVGKTPLGRFLSRELCYPHHDLDEFLCSPGMPFLEQIDYLRLSQKLQRPKNIVSGICVIAALRNIGMVPDLSIYMVHKSEAGVPESYDLLAVDRDPSIGMPWFGNAKLAKEIWLYHQQYRPLTNASVLYLSDGKSIPFAEK